MIIKQVSVFLENKTGRIYEVTKTLSRHGINMQAFSMAETPDFGILRLIVSDVDKAVEILREADFAVMLTDVVCLHCPNKAGALGEILEQLAHADVSIEYMYAFAEGDMANIVVRPTDIERCAKALEG
jgi:hypothetical protein